MRGIYCRTLDLSDLNTINISLNSFTCFGHSQKDVC